MNAKGRVHKFGDNVDTDVIIPARYLNTASHKELAAHCMEDIDAQFVNKVQEGDIMVAEKNFGCGSSREHAPIAIKASGISCVIASTFARIFYRNAINIGLPILECDEAAKEITRSTSVCRSLSATRRQRRSRTATPFRSISTPALSPTRPQARPIRRSPSPSSSRTSFKRAV